MKKIETQLTSGLFTKQDIIDRYTRKQAIEDGFLFDVTGFARQMGFKYPVALTVGVQSLLNQAVEKKYSSYFEALYKLLCALFDAAKKEESNRCDFEAPCFSKYTGGIRKMPFYSVCDGGDDGRPVLTVLLPNED